MNIITEIDVVNLIKQTFPQIKDVPVALSFTQSGLLTSMDLVTLIFEIEKRFAVSFDFENMDLKAVDAPISIAETVNVMKGINHVTLRTMIDDICSDNLEKVALTFDNKELNYAELYSSIKRLASGFYSYGIKKGSHVVIMLDNCIEYILSYFSLFYIGAIPVPINTRWNKQEIKKVVMDSEAEFFIVQEKSGNLRYADVIQVLKEDNHLLKKVFYIGDNYYAENGCAFEVVMNSEIQSEFEEIDGSDIAMISYTSGTTGTPKGVTLKHCDIVKISMYTTKVWAEKEDTSFSIAPLYSAQGFLSLLINFSLESRFKMISSFDPNDILKEISKGTETIFHTQPTMWTMLLNSKIIDFTKFTNLKELIVSGSLCSPELAKRIEAKLGCELLNAYGLIEGTSVVTMTRRGDPEEIRYNTVGRPIPGVEIKIVNQNRNVVPFGEIGELAIKGYVMGGYYNNEEKTKEIMDEDGWLYTGDLAKYYDKENISIVGRCKDMVIRGGFNVYPSDIEEVLLQIPEVQIAAVIGRPHKVLGEELVAFVVPKAGASLKKTDISKYVFANIANYKQPDGIYLISDMPTILAGKIDKKELYKWATEGIPKEKEMLFS